RRVARPAAPTETRPQRAEAPGTRPRWFECACCPPNIMRTVASLGGYVATHTEAGVQLHQYLPATIAAGAVSLAVATRYPLDGLVEVTVTGTPDPQWTLSLRVPGWCRGATVTVNGEPVTVTTGYVDICRAWRAGDVVALSMPMPLRLTVSHPAVDAVRGTVAVERGPLVYCFESPDQADGVDLNRVELLVDSPLSEEDGEVLGEPVVVAVGRGVLRDDSAWARTGWASLDEMPAPAGRTVELRAIPYHLWANRGPSVMRIFIPVR
ncbi:MAG TPA: glycoside hydrolase family 127 protein, partial [Micromonosporaceae bacterium]|nr:glycoside hydrolase family 127 protein [Micromonosporaceae bacterium]